MFKGIFKLNHCTYTFPAHHSKSHTKKPLSIIILFSHNDPPKKMPDDKFLISCRYILYMYYYNIFFTQNSKHFINKTHGVLLTTNNILFVFAYQNDFDTPLRISVDHKGNMESIKM